MLRFEVDTERAVEIRQTGDWPSAPFDKGAAAAGGLGSESLSATRR